MKTRHVVAVAILLLTLLLTGCNIAPGVQAQMLGFGYVNHKALTPTYTVIDEGFLVLYGDTLTLDYDIEVSRGKIELAVWRIDYGLPSRVRLDVEHLWKTEVTSSDKQTVTVELPGRGHYKVEIALHGFKGDLKVRWKTQK